MNSPGLLRDALVLVALLLGPAGAAYAQCGMGIPGAGNPGCIPPDVLNQQNNTSQQQPRTVIIRYKWADRWGAMIADEDHPVFGVSSGASSKKKAIKLAQLDCFKKGGGVCGDPFTYSNGCAAFIGVKGGGVYYGAGPTVEGASNIGMERCQKDGKECVVIYTECSHAEAVPVR